MSSLRQIEANRRNARLSTGPITDEGKKRSRQNAARHGLTAETVIDALEDAEDYAAFEMAVTADYDAQSAVERELVLRLASLLWRLRRTTAIETGLFELQARQLLRFRQRRGVRRAREEIINGMYLGSACGNNTGQEALAGGPDVGAASAADFADQSEGITSSFVRLNNLPTCPLDRLSRYEATLWRQACQILFTLHYLNRRRS
jgi:hypothetical protein